MAYPNGIRGGRDWGRDGHAPDVELCPAWVEALPRADNGAVKLTRDGAFEIALLNSREYQTARERVYLPALALSLNRFEFQTQWFAGVNPTFAHVGSGGVPFESNTLDATGLRAGFSRNLYAGGQALVNFANSFVWEYTGETSRVSTTVSGSLVQPLLRGFGRDIRLETLVQAERDVLYAVREYARTRKAIWADVTTNQTGYLGLLLSVQQVRNAKFNLRITEENFRIAEARFAGGKVAAAEYDQTLQTLLTARQGLINSEIDLQSALDAFKLRLGLPPRLPVELDDAPLERFVLVAPDLEAAQEAVAKYLTARGAELSEPPAADFLAARLGELADLLPRAETGLKAAAADVAAWTADRKTAAADLDPQMKAAGDREYDRTGRELAELRAELAATRQAVATAREGVTRLKPADGWAGAVAAGRRVQDLLTDIANIQTRARIYRIRLPAIDADESAALAQAKADRLDLQNSLGTVTDQWRKVRVAANALKSDLSVTVAGDAGLPADAHNPLAFNANNSVLRVGVKLDGPLNRRAERNAYRAQLIGYHAARRSYLAASDGVEQQIRLDLRSLAQTRANFEISRQSLLIAARQLLSSRRQQNAPVPAGGGRDSAGDTLLLLQAQAQLLSARNQLAGLFIGYEQQRVRLLLDLEALQLDARGVPTNDAAPEPSSGGSRPPADPATPPPAAAPAP